MCAGFGRGRSRPRPSCVHQTLTRTSSISHKRRLSALRANETETIQKRRRALFTRFFFRLGGGGAGEEEIHTMINWQRSPALARCRALNNDSLRHSIHHLSLISRSASRIDFFSILSPAPPPLRANAKSTVPLFPTSKHSQAH